MTWPRGLVALTLAFLASLTAAHSAPLSPYHLADVDWPAAASATIAADQSTWTQVENIAGFSAKAAALKKHLSNGLHTSPISDDLIAINVVASVIHPNIAEAGSPVLLPVDFGKFTNGLVATGHLEQLGKKRDYFGPLRSTMFEPGALGYRAFYRVGENSTVLVSGSSIFYDLKERTPFPALRDCSAWIAEARAGNVSDADFARNLKGYEQGNLEARDGYYGVKEAAVPCMFAHALIEISILCNTSDESICSTSLLGRAIFRSLSFVGGAPQPSRVKKLLDGLTARIAAEATLSAQSAKVKTIYGAPGALIPGTVYGGSQSGATEDAIFGLITYPLEISAVAQTVVFREDHGENVCAPGWSLVGFSGQCRRDRPYPGTAESPTYTPVIPGVWGDNFCEDRSANVLFSCPAGEGHAGQDLWGPAWVNYKQNLHCHPLVATVDSIAFRRFEHQPAVTLADVNGLNVDYIYRHVYPNELKAHGIPASGPKPVKQGQVIAFVGNLQEQTGGTCSANDKSRDCVNGYKYDLTAPHLHLEIRVPTKAGFRYAPPYPTLVLAHKALESGVVKRIEPKDECRRS